MLFIIFPKIHVQIKGKKNTKCEVMNQFQEGKNYDPLHCLKPGIHLQKLKEKEIVYPTKAKLNQTLLLTGPNNQVKIHCAARIIF